METLLTYTKKDSAERPVSGKTVNNITPTFEGQMVLKGEDEDEELVIPLRIKIKMEETLFDKFIEEMKIKGFGSKIKVTMEPGPPTIDEYMEDEDEED